MRRIQKRPQRASRRSRQAPDHVGKTDGVGPAPRHEGPLNHVDQLFLLFVVRIPVAEDRQHFLRGVVNRHQIGGQAEVIFEVEEAGDLEDRPHPVFVVAVLLLALDLVVGLRGTSQLGLLRGYEADLAIHARANSLLKLKAGQILDVRLALGSVEAGGAVGQINVVDGHEDRHGPIALLVPDHFHVLSAAKRDLRGQLLKLRPELNHLLGQLPVHELLLALGLLALRLRHFSGNVFLDRAIGWEDFLDHTRREIHAGLGEHRMHHLGRALKVSATGGIIAQSSAAQALLVLLVTQRAGFLVTLDELQKLAGDHHHVRVRHLLCEVCIELGILSLIRLVKRYGRRAVVMLFDIAFGIGIHVNFGARLVFVHVTTLSGLIAESCH